MEINVAAENPEKQVNNAEKVRRVSASGFDFGEELSKLPAQPGVYIMHDEKDAIIYVGKAKSLRSRVRSYFRANIGRGPAIDQMVRQIVRFEYIVTDSELEALILENNLIKEHRPKYNTLLVDDKTYPYIKVTVAEPYPRILFSRSQKKDKSRYFGPYSSAAAVRDTIELLNRMYGLRDCNRVLPRDADRDRPCLNYYMKRCSGPCRKDEISPEAYRERVDLALEFLSGHYDIVLKDLKGRMTAASEALNYEEAAKYRDLLSSVQQVAQRQKMSEATDEDRDILGIAMDEENADADAVVQTFFIRGGRLMGREHFYMNHVGGKRKEEILSEFLKQFYGGTPFIPKEIMLPADIEDRDVIGQWLSSRRGGKVTIRVPQKGQKEKLVALACENAQLLLQKDKERMRREEGRTIGAVRELEALLHIGHIDRMESYDISDISGFANVGSMVVYEKGKPKRSDYRKFRIRTVAGPDDYACMREVLTRRFTHGMEEKIGMMGPTALPSSPTSLHPQQYPDLPEEPPSPDFPRGASADADVSEGKDELRKKPETPGRAAEDEESLSSFAHFPDLILMDGGRGQVNICLAVLEELGLSIPVAGMVKDDNHRTRGLYYNNEEIPIDAHSEGFKLITRIQDETHRFAIEYHRSLRSREQVHSRLDDIPGVGPARKKALMRTYRSIEEIAAADAEEIGRIPEIPQSVADEVYRYFHAKDAGGG